MYHHGTTIEIVYNSLGGLLKEMNAALKENHLAEITSKANKALNDFERLHNEFWFLVEELESLKQQIYKPTNGEKICTAKYSNHTSAKATQSFISSQQHLSETLNYKALGASLNDLQSSLNQENIIMSNQVNEAVKFYYQLLIEYDGLVEDVKLLRAEANTLDNEIPKHIKRKTNIR